MSVNQILEFSNIYNTLILINTCSRSRLVVNLNSSDEYVFISSLNLFKKLYTERGRRRSNKRFVNFRYLLVTRNEQKSSAFL